MSRIRTDIVADVTSEMRELGEGERVDLHPRLLNRCDLQK
jgi:hypothetical protein